MHHPPHFPPLPRLSPHHKKRADVEQRFNTPKGSISPKHTAHSLLFPPISSFPAIFSFAHFRPLLPFSLFIRPRPLPSFPANLPLSLFFLPTLPNLPSLLQFFLLYPFLSHPKNKKNPHPRKKNLIIKKKCCN